MIVKGKVLSLEIESNETWQFKYQVRIELHYINVSHHSEPVPQIRTGV